MPYFIATTDIDNNINGFGTQKRGDTLYVQDQLVFDTAAQAGHPKLCPMPKELEAAIDNKREEYWQKSRELDKQKELEIRTMCLTYLRDVER